VADLLKTEKALRKGLAGLDDVTTRLRKRVKDLEEYNA
jgi:hypothetical protein